MINNKLAPNYKEMVLNICIVAPFFLLVLTPHVEKEHIWLAYFTDAVAYCIARTVYKIKTGSWQW